MKSTKIRSNFLEDGTIYKNGLWSSRKMGRRR